MTASSARILFVDDDPTLLYTMSELFIWMGYEVKTASSGIEAIDYTQEQPFDITFLDIKMPFMNGVEICRNLKRIRPYTLIIMMTAMADEEVLQAAIDAGAQQIIYKPPDIDAMVTLINRSRQQGATS